MLSNVRSVLANPKNSQAVGIISKETCDVVQANTAVLYSSCITVQFLPRKTLTGHSLLLLQCQASPRVIQADPEEFPRRLNISNNRRLARTSRPAHSVRRPLTSTSYLITARTTLFDSRFLNGIRPPKAVDHSLCPNHQRIRSSCHLRHPTYTFKCLHPPYLRIQRTGQV
jgi:hypothetical protein